MRIKKYITTNGKIRYEVLDGNSVVKDNLTKIQAQKLKEKEQAKVRRGGY